MLLRALPPDALFRYELQVEQERALKPTPEQIRARQEHYNQRAKGGA